MQGLPNLTARIMGGDQPPAAPFTDPIIATVMQQSARMASEAAVQKGAEEEAGKLAKRKPIEIHTRIDPVTGESTNTYKNIPTGGEADQAIAAKAAEPFLDVAESATQGALEHTRTLAAKAIENYIATLPKPTAMGGSSPFEGVGALRGGFRAARELGASPAGAALDALRVRFGLVPQARAERQVDRARSLNIVRSEQQLAAPIQREETAIEAAGGTAATRERLRISDLNSRATKLLQTTDFTAVPKENWYETLVAQDPAIAELPGLKNRVNVAGGVAVKRDTENRYQESRKDKAALGTFDSYAEVKAAFGSAPDQEKEAQREADYRAARNSFVTATTQKQLDLQLKAGQIAAQREANRIARTAADAAAAGVTGEAAVKDLPSDLKNLVRGIASGAVDITKVTSQRGGQRQAMAELVMRFDPTWSTAVAPARAATVKDFTSGKAANNVRSINTAVKHLASLETAAEQLQNAPIQVLNRIKNFGLQQVGDSRVTNFKNAATAVESEMANVFKGTGATDQEIKAWRENINAAQSPEQMKQAITTMIELMAGRLSALSDQYLKGTGRTPDFRILSEESRKILRKLGHNPDELEAAVSAVATPGAKGRVITDPNEILTIFGKGKKQ